MGYSCIFYKKTHNIANKNIDKSNIIQGLLRRQLET